MIATAQAIGSIELLSFPPQSTRANQVATMLDRTARACGLRLKASTTYQGGSDLLILWGPGHPSRFEPMRRQMESGGHVAAFDLSYWDRQRKLRVSIDAAHPQEWVMRKDWPADRFAKDAVTVADRWDPKGPVIVAGIGEKATVQYGNAVALWEAAMMATCRERGWTVKYRAKRGATIPIDQALDGARLVLTWHSNVAIDAIRLGIPVVCQDGAAAAVCPSILSGGGPEPLLTAVRDRFLRNLAWFQWDLATEANPCLAWLQELLS